MWLVGIALAVVVIIATFYFNLQKYAIIIATAIGGAGLIVGTLMFANIGMTLAEFFENPIRFALNDSPLWTIFFLVMAGLGIAAQLYSSRAYEVEAYENRIQPGNQGLVFQTLEPRSLLRGSLRCLG